LLTDKHLQVFFYHAVLKSVRTEVLKQVLKHHVAEHILGCYPTVSGCSTLSGFGLGCSAFQLPDFDVIYSVVIQLSHEKNKMSYFNFFTHPEFNRFTSDELCPSLKSERGEATLWWLGVSELKYDNKYIS